MLLAASSNASLARRPKRTPIFQKRYSAMLSYIKRKLNGNEEVTPEKRSRMDRISVSSFVRFDSSSPDILVGINKDYLVIGELKDHTDSMGEDDCMELPIDVLPVILRSIRSSFSQEGQRDQAAFTGLLSRFLFNNKVREVTYQLASPSSEEDSFVLSSTGTNFTVIISRSNVAKFFLGLEMLCFEMISLGKPFAEFVLYDIIDNAKFLDVLKGCRPGSTAVSAFKEDYWPNFWTLNKEVLSTLYPELTKNDELLKQLMRVTSGIVLYSDLMSEIQENKAFVGKG